MADSRHTDEVTLLCVGDLHIGRTPSRMSPETLAGTGIDPRDLSPAAAWGRIVDAALEREVDAVVLLGDVVDEDNALLEAVGPFGHGVQRLAAARIPVIAIAGNHDVDALPRLVDAIDGIDVLGRGATWETRVVRGARGGAVRLLGWSFAQRVHAVSPLATLPEAYRAGTWNDDADAAAPTIGLLHCDLDAAVSRHAPVRRADLEATALDAWLLGHIHRPDELDQARPIGYLGSVVGLDPGEAGTRGAWLARCSARGVRMERLQVARHRYERATLDIGRIEHPADAVAALIQLARETHVRVLDQLGDERIVVARLHVHGEHPHHAAIIDELTSAGELGASWTDIDGVLHMWEPQIRDRGRTAIDLDALAGTQDLAAPLAALAIDAARDTPAPVDPELVRRMRDHLQRTVLNTAPFRENDLVQIELSDEMVVQLIRESLGDALDALEAHRASNHASQDAMLEVAR